MTALILTMLRALVFIGLSAYLLSVCQSLQPRGSGEMVGSSRDISGERGCDTPGRTNQRTYLHPPEDSIQSLHNIDLS